MSTYPFADLELARRLEDAEAKGSLAFVQSRAQLDPSLGACSLRRAGAYAFFDGIDSPLTQSFCLGLFETADDADLDALERFFLDRGAAPAFEVSPLAGVPTFGLLARRGYQPVELTSVLFQPVAPRTEERGGIRVRLGTRDEADLFSSTAAEGWGNSEELKAFMRDVGRVSAAAEGMSIFFAEMDGRPVATGTLSIQDGVACLLGASTIPSARNRGAQHALLDARLRFAAEHGCDLATMGAEPGSASQRNAERNGFRIAYTRVKWGRP